jgi:predicted RNA-binding Zn-ribbon protein involved in translation (DUF1610 family)
MRKETATPLDSPPTKVCASCSVQTQTSGEFCPHCGNSYVARRRRLGRKTIAGIVVGVLLLGGTAAGTTLKVRHDRDQERAEAVAAGRQAAEKAAGAKEEARQRRIDAKTAAEQAERRQRASVIRQMQSSITKDAKKRVASGELEGPIYYTQCDPLGGGSVDDLTALTTTFECLAVNEKLSGGQVRGWVFSSTVHWDEASWSWQLGR